VPTRAVLGGAPIRVRFRHLNDMFLGAAGADMLQMTVIEIINVIAMTNGCMATAWTMDVRILPGRLIAGWHWGFLSSHVRRGICRLICF
jgi:hypothetical protein